MYRPWAFKPALDLELALDYNSPVSCLGMADFNNNCNSFLVIILWVYYVLNMTASVVWFQATIINKCKQILDINGKPFQQMFGYLYSKRNVMAPSVLA